MSLINHLLYQIQYPRLHPSEQSPSSPPVIKYPTQRSPRTHSDSSKGKIHLDFNNHEHEGNKDKRESFIHKTNKQSSGEEIIDEKNLEEKTTKEHSPEERIDIEQRSGIITKEILGENITTTQQINNVQQKIGKQ